MKQISILYLSIAFSSAHTAELLELPRLPAENNWQTMHIEEQIDYLTNKVRTMRQRLEHIRQLLADMKIWIEPTYERTLKFYCNKVDNYIYVIPNQFTDQDVISARKACFDVNNFSEKERDKAKNLINGYIINYIKIGTGERMLDSLREKFNEYNKKPALRHPNT